MNKSIDKWNRSEQNRLDSIVKELEVKVEELRADDWTSNEYIEMAEMLRKAEIDASAYYELRGEQ